MNAEESAEVALTHTPEVTKILVDNHRAFLHFLEKRVGSRAVAEDILQEAFARGLERLDSLRSNESAVAWFYRVLRNAVIDYRRKQATTAKALDAFAGELEVHAAAPAQVEAAICACVSQLASALKPEYADALRKVEIDGMPVKDFAESAGISSSNAGVRVFRARDALRKQVAKACGTCAEHGCLDCTCNPSGSTR